MSAVLHDFVPVRVRPGVCFIVVDLVSPDDGMTLGPFVTMIDGKAPSLGARTLESH